MRDFGKRRVKIKAEDIRKSFVEYFKNKGHKEIPSSSVIPFDDPTLLFANAGMNQFKDIFTGKKKAEHQRAVTVQKCMRAGGKHNDLENVGRTGRHQTFFEMLGNFSFGDYFKEEAITYGWEWVNKVLGMPPERLFATVFEDDSEAFALWERIAPELKDGRILRFGKKDNYWSMGEIGPNGPCSEIHYDRGAQFGCGKPSCGVNCDCERYVEIWNLVFMQFDQKPDGTMEKLPRPSVDTGAGLERITSIIQNVHSNYETDLFADILKHISELCGQPYDSGESGVSHRVIADHVRALTFCIADGGGISNEKQGYVLRRILRRAARHGRLLEMHEPFIHKLVPTLVGVMGSVYPEIKQKQAHIENVIRSEEESFGRTLDTGLELFEEIAGRVKGSGGRVIDGAEIFKLYDTYGFPVDLTAVMAEEKGLTLDMAGFEKGMAGQQEKSRQASQFDNAIDQEMQALLNILQKDEAVRNLRTEFVREDFTAGARLLEVIQAPEQPANRLALIPERSPFYAEAGGQIGDTGHITGEKFKARVVFLFKYNDCLVHVCDVHEKGYNSIAQLKGTTAEFSVDAERRWDIMRNHTATHLLHAALRKVLGDHVHQSGSYVGPDKLRFDFSHFRPLTSEEIGEVERLINEKIIAGSPVLTSEDDLEKARKSGAMAIFGEKYGSRVRVVSVEDFSKELCGGTHVDIVSQIGPMIIITETGIASGVRRIEAITGRTALQRMREQKGILEEISRAVNRPAEELAGAINELNRRLTDLQKENKKLKAEKFTGGGSTIGQDVELGKGVNFRFHDFGEVEPDEIAGWVDGGKSAKVPLITAATGTIGGKSTFMVSTSAGVGVHIGNVMRDILKAIGGRGGGKENFAQGSVPAGVNGEQFLVIVKERLGEEVSKK